MNIPNKGRISSDDILLAQGNTGVVAVYVKEMLNGESRDSHNNIARVYGAVFDGRSDGVGFLLDVTDPDETYEVLLRKVNR